MLQRNTSTKDVELILSEPDGKIELSQNKYFFIKKLKGRKDNLVATVTVLRAVDTFGIVTLTINLVLYFLTLFFVKRESIYLEKKKMNFV